MIGSHMEGDLQTSGPTTVMRWSANVFRPPHWERWTRLHYSAGVEEILGWQRVCLMSPASHPSLMLEQWVHLLGVVVARGEVA